MKMFRTKLVLMTVVVLCAFVGFGCGQEHEEGNQIQHHGHRERWQKIKRCINETRDLYDCCPTPSLKEDEDCKQHLEDLENKEEGKERQRARNCFHECLFKRHGLFEDGQLADRQKIKDSFESYLKAKNGDDFIEMSMTSIDYCMDKFAEMQEKMKEMAEKLKKPGSEDSDATSNKREKCHWLPTAFIGCIEGNIVRNCPETKWQTTDECKAKKANATPMDECIKV